MAYRTRWTRLLSGTALAATAALAAVGCTSGSATSASGSTQGAAPQVTMAEANRAYQHIIAAILGTTGTQEQALSDTTDVDRVAANTSLLLQRYYNENLSPKNVVELGRPVFYLPESTGYPQWFVANTAITYNVPALPPGGEWTGAPGGIQWENVDSHALFVFKKASATTPWQLAGQDKVAPSTSVPALAADSGGHVPTVPLTDTALLTRPDIAGPLQAAVVDDGPASPAAKVVATGPLTTGIYDNERAGLLGLTAPRGDVLQWELDGSNYDNLALRTADGGALVFYAMYLNTTVQTKASLALASPLDPGPKISVPGLLVPLLPPAQRAPRIKLEGQQLLSFAAVDPPAGNGRIQVIAIGGYWSYASAS